MTYTKRTTGLQGRLFLPRHDTKLCPALPAGHQPFGLSKYLQSSQRKHQLWNQTSFTRYQAGVTSELTALKNPTLESVPFGFSGVPELSALYQEGLWTLGSFFLSL